MRNLVRAFVVAAVVSQVALGQTTPHKAKAPSAKPGVSAWTPEVQQYLGVQQGSFTMVGLNRLSKAQLDALVNSAKINYYSDPKKHVLTCGPATPAANGQVRVLVTVAGDDSTGARNTEIQQAVKSLSGVELVDSAANADRALHVVIQEQTLGKRTIGYTASYVTATPCVDESGGKKTDGELKGQLGTYTDPKGADLAHDLAGMLDKDLQTSRGR